MRQSSVAAREDLRPAGDERGFPFRPTDIGLLALVAAFHIYATWGSAALYLGDYGAWLHAVERFAAGETPYTDFYWMYPPLSLWVLGIPARVFGASLPVIWTVTSLVSIGIVWIFARYVSLVAPHSAVRATFFIGILFALAYAPIGSAPLAMGMYTPAAPLAGLLILTAAVAGLRAIETEDWIYGVLLGVTTALCVFTKQDVWPPALYLLLVGSFLARRRQGLHPLVPLGSCAAVMAIGTVYMASVIGWTNLPRMVWTPGIIDVVGGRGQFSWESLTIQLGVVGGIVAVVTGIAYAFDTGRSRLRTIAIASLALAALATVTHIALSYVSGMQFAAGPADALPTTTQEFVTSAGTDSRPVLKRSVLFLIDRVSMHMIPAILPFFVAALVLFRSGGMADDKRRLVLFLLGLAISARMRRGFEHVDWFHALIEIPAYVLFLTAFLRLKTSGRAMRTLFALLVVVGGYAHWVHGAGRLSRRGTSVNLPVESVRGTFLSTTRGRAWLDWLRMTLDELDPEGSVPLLAFGQTGGLNFYVGRENPTPWMLGTELSFWDRDEILAPLIPPGRELFFLDVAMYKGLTRPRRGFALDRWDLAREPTRFRIDETVLGPFTRDCELVGSTGNPENPFFKLYWCSRE